MCLTISDTVGNGSDLDLTLGNFRIKSLPAGASPQDWKLVVQKTGSELVGEFEGVSPMVCNVDCSWKSKVSSEDYTTSSQEKSKVIPVQLPGRCRVAEMKKHIKVATGTVVSQFQSCIA